VTDASIDNVIKRFEDMSDTEETSESTTSESTSETTSVNVDNSTNESSSESTDDAGIGGGGASGITSIDDKSSNVMVAYSTAKFGSKDTVVSGSATE
jgi:hypothetical protein